MDPLLNTTLINEHISFMKYACELYQQGYTHVLCAQFESLEDLVRETKILWGIFQAHLDVADSNARQIENGLTVSVADVVRVLDKCSKGTFQEHCCFYLLIKPGTDFDVLDSVFAIRPFIVNLI
jgi:hypothetical protein